MTEPRVLVHPVPQGVLVRRHRCNHLTQGWDGDLLRCVDCRTLLGKAYDAVEDYTPEGDRALFMVYDARHCGGLMAAGTVIDYRTEVPA